MNDDYDTLNGHNFVKYGPIFKSFTFLESSFSALSSKYPNSISKISPTRLVLCCGVTFLYSATKWSVYSSYPGIIMCYLRDNKYVQKSNGAWLSSKHNVASSFQ